MAVNVSTGLAQALLSDFGILSYLDFGIIEIRTGPPPDSADDAPTGTLLGRVTRDGLPFVEGTGTAGLRADVTSVRGQLRDNGDWLLTVVANGLAGWWRWRWYPVDDQSTSTYLPRIDGAVGDSLILANPNLTTANSPITVAFSMQFGA
jgi:hypothetical protein